MSNDKHVPLDRLVVPSRRAYMDLTDFFWELGQTTTKTYSSIDAVKRDQSKCIEECGIVEVTVSLRRIVRRPTGPKGGRS